MNWLAHVFLSEHDVDFRLGNLLADLVRGEERAGMSAGFLRGARCHKAIDSFTDAHALVRRSRLRLGAQYRRFSGVLVDVFYDYFLATRWSEYSSVPLAAFTADFYLAARNRRMQLPRDAQATLDRIIQHDLLGQYAHIEGVESSLRRLSTYLSARWKRDFALGASISVLREQESDLAEDFAAFFPQLRHFVAAGSW